MPRVQQTSIPISLTAPTILRTRSKSLLSLTSLHEAPMQTREAPRCLACSAMKTTFSRGINAWTSTSVWYRAACGQ